jgi:pyruvate-ferredoxin/flavodoxin oxidoreductase
MGAAHQHDHADLLLRDLRRAAADEAIAKIKDAIKKTYGKQGRGDRQEELERGRPVLGEPVRDRRAGAATSDIPMPPAVPEEAPEFVKDVLGTDHRRPRATPADQRCPDRRHLPDRHDAVGEAQHRPGDPGLGSGCASSAASARWSARTRDPHEGLRSEAARRRPATFKHAKYKGKEFGHEVTVQVAPEDCTGCGVCVEACPAKNKKEVRLKAINMAFQPPLREPERENYTSSSICPSRSRAS